MRKRFLIGLLLCVLMLSGCANPVNRSVYPLQPKETEEQPEKEVTYLSIATSGKWEGILRGDLMEKYCKKVEEWSDGTLILKMYYNGALGGDLELIAGAKKGTLNIINCVPTYQAPAVPEAVILDTPGLFNSIEEYNTFMEGDYGKVMQSYYEKAGLHLLSGRAFTYRVMTSRFAVTTMKDMKNLRMRSMEDNQQVTFWQSMGCTVTPMSWPSVRTAMQQNILAAQENPLAYMISSNLQDVQGYVLLTNHMLMISSYLMNKEQYDALSEEHKAILDRFFEEMETELILGEAAEEQEMRQMLEKRGIVFTEPSEEIRQGIASGRDVVLQSIRKKLGDTFVDEFLEALEESRRKNG